MQPSFFMRAQVLPTVIYERPQREKESCVSQKRQPRRALPWPVPRNQCCRGPRLVHLTENAWCVLLLFRHQTCPTPWSPSSPAHPSPPLPQHHPLEACVRAATPRPSAPSAHRPSSAVRAASAVHPLRVSCSGTCWGRQWRGHQLTAQHQKECVVERPWRVCCMCLALL